MEPSSQFQRYESSYRLLSSEFNVIKEELSEFKQEFSNVVDENKRFFENFFFPINLCNFRLRNDLKEALSNQISNISPELVQNLNSSDKNVIQNYEKQLQLLKKVILKNLYFPDRDLF